MNSRNLLLLLLATVAACLFSFNCFSQTISEKSLPFLPTGKVTMALNGDKKAIDTVKINKLPSSSVESVFKPLPPSGIVPLNPMYRRLAPSDTVPLNNQNNSSPKVH